VCAVLLCGVIAARLLDEERYLSRTLPGYEGYCRKVRYRLLPHVWLLRFARSSSILHFSVSLMNTPKQVATHKPINSTGPKHPKE
jgi:hypothetical protein